MATMEVLGNLLKVVFTSHFQRLVTSLTSRSLTARAAWPSRSERQQPWIPIQAEEISDFQQCRRQNLEGSQMCYEKRPKIQQVILPFPAKQKTFRLHFLEPFGKEFFEANHGWIWRSNLRNSSSEHPFWLWSCQFLWLESMQIASSCPCIEMTFSKLGQISKNMCQRQQVSTP